MFLDSSGDCREADKYRVFYPGCLDALYFYFFFPHPIRSVIASVFIQLTEKDDINVLLLEDKA